MSKEEQQTGNWFLKAPCKIAKCICVHTEQDKIYGAMHRVHNPSKKGYRCTVCGKEK